MACCCRASTVFVPCSCVGPIWGSETESESCIYTYWAMLALFFWRRITFWERWVGYLLLALIWLSWDRNRMSQSRCRTIRYRWTLCCQWHSYWVGDQNFCSVAILPWEYIRIWRFGLSRVGKQMDWEDLLGCRWALWEFLSSTFSYEAYLKENGSWTLLNAILNSTALYVDVESRNTGVAVYTWSNKLPAKYFEDRENMQISTAFTVMNVCLESLASVFKVDQGLPDTIQQ